MTLPKDKWLLLKTVKYANEEGAEVIFRGKGTNQGEQSFPPGICQADLLVIYPEGVNKCIEVVTPKHTRAAVERLQGIPLPLGWIKEVHVWWFDGRGPDVLRVTNT